MGHLNYMQTFVQIVDCGGISKAAKRMNVAKSAVSRHLSELEIHCGANLLIRTTRTQLLTKEGEYYYQHSQQILRDIAMLEENIGREFHTLKGLIKVAIPTAFGDSFLGAVLRKFDRENPDLQLEINFSDQKIDLVEDGFDLAIRISRLRDSSLKARKLSSLKMLLVGSNSYFEKYGKPGCPQDLMEGHVRLRYTEGSESWRFIDSEESEFSVKIPHIQSSNSASFLCESAVEGLGLLYMPDFVCHDAIRNNQLEAILDEFFIDSEIGVYAIYPQSKYLSRRVRCLIDYLVDALSENRTS